MTQVEKQIKTLEDMLQGAINQRNNALNECMHLSATVQDYKRTNEQQAAEIEALTKKLAEATAGDKPPESMAKANGYAQEMSAA